MGILVNKQSQFGLKIKLSRIILVSFALIATATLSAIIINKNLSADNSHAAEHEVNLFFDIDDGSNGPATQTCTESPCTITISNTVPTREGYTFFGWAKSIDMHNTEANYLPGNTIELTSDTTLYAVWQKTDGTQCAFYFIDSITNNLVYSALVNKDPQGLCSIVEQMHLLIHHPGYQLIGFSSSRNGQVERGAYIEYWITTNDSITWYYVFEPVATKLTFDANGGSGAPATQNCNNNPCTITIPNDIPSRSGYHFLGWSESSTATTASYQPSNTITLTSNKTLYAVWIQGYRIIMIDAMSGEIFYNESCPSYDVCLVNDFWGFNAPSHEGYTLEGLATKPGGRVIHPIWDEYFSVPGGGTFYAIYSALPPINIYYDANGGINAPATQTCYGSTCTIKISGAAPIRNNYQFLGWAESRTATSAIYQIGDSVSLSASKTLYAVWGALTRTLTIDSNNDGIISTQTCNTDVPNGSCSVAISDAIPTRDHYHFYGYADSTTATIAAYQPGGNITLTSDKMIYAIWIPEYILYYDLKFGHFSGTLGSCYPDTPGGTCDVWIIDENPPRENYDFQGWAANSNTNTVTYHPGDTVNLSASTTIYAVWKKQSSDHGDHDLDGCNNHAMDISDAICLQDMNNLVKYSMQYNTEYELVDARDGTVYRIARLADNNVWLLDNLQLGSEQETHLTSNDTNTNPNLNNGEFILPASGDWTDSYTEPSIDTTDADVMLGNNADKVQGGYYNYCAASAGTYCDEADEATDDAEYDICPANWRMPTGDNGGEYQIIDNLYDDLINTLHLPLSGRFYGGSSGQIDQNGYFWSSTNRDGMRMYYLNRSNQTINATGSYRRDRGYSVRCVAKNITPQISCNVGAKDIDEAVCLQDVNAMVKASMEEEEIYTLLDSRDLEPYRIAKLQDDNVWLLDNLKLGSNEAITLTSQDTNTNPELNNGEFILPASGDWTDSYTEPAVDTTNAHNMLGGNSDKTQGGYYNYCAASAGTYCDEADEAEGDAEYDICPANWRMPTGGDEGEYQIIDSLYDNLINTLFLPLSGRFYGGSSGQIDQNGYFWSSTNRDGMRMYYLHRSNQNIDTTGSYRRDRGYSIRCIVNTAKKGTMEYAWKDNINEHTINDDSDLTFIISLSLNALTSVQVDHEELSKDDYTLSSGSTIITLKTNYLDTLAVGSHLLTAVYGDGTTISSEFIIYDDIVVPNTGTSTKGHGTITVERIILPILVGIITTSLSFSVFIKRQHLHKS